MTTDTKVAIVTGAGSGIGKYSALALLKEGYRVVLAGRRSEPLEETATEANVPDAQVLVVPTDVTEPQSIENLFSQTASKFGRLDVLFNNAGIGGTGKLLEDIPLEDWLRVVNTNLTGVFLCTQAAFRIMKQQNPKGGRIINNGSISAHTPRPNSISYTATKHAVSGMTKSINLDGRKYNIVCCQIDIGNASTPMTARMSGGVMQANGEVKPEPTMDVNNVAQAIVYMANLPLDANVPFMTIMASQMPYIGRG